jgi:hypothetical protein
MISGLALWGMIVGRALGPSNPNTAMKPSGEALRYDLHSNGREARLV